MRCSRARTARCRKRGGRKSRTSSTIRRWFIWLPIPTIKLPVSNRFGNVQPSVMAAPHPLEHRSVFVRSSARRADTRAMRTYVLRRLLQTIPLLLGISLITFLLLQLAPGDFLNQMAENPGISAETIEAMRVRFGLDKPWYVQYGIYLRNVVLLFRLRPVVRAPPAGVRRAERRLHQHAAAGGCGRARHLGARDSARRDRGGEAALLDRSGRCRSSPSSGCRFPKFSRRCCC